MRPNLLECGKWSDNSTRLRFEFERDRIVRVEPHPIRTRRDIHFLRSVGTLTLARIDDEAVAVDVGLHPSDAAIPARRDEIEIPRIRGIGKADVFGHDSIQQLDPSLAIAGLEGRVTRFEAKLHVEISLGGCDRFSFGHHVSRRGFDLGRAIAGGVACVNDLGHEPGTILVTEQRMERGLVSENLLRKRLFRLRIHRHRFFDTYVARLCKTDCERVPYIGGRLNARRRTFTLAWFRRTARGPGGHVDREVLLDAKAVSARTRRFCKNTNRNGRFLEQLHALVHAPRQPEFPKESAELSELAKS